VADGYGYGVSSLDIGSDVTGRNRDTIDRAIDDLVSSALLSQIYPGWIELILFVDCSAGHRFL
jgi:hypothetical protein